MPETETAPESAATPDVKKDGGLLRFLLILAIVAWAFRSFVVAPFSIPSGSMLPTLYIGDYQGGLRVVDISGELRGDLLAQDREMAWVHTGDASGYVPNAAMAWGAFYHNGLVWVNDVFSGLWAVKIEPKEPPRAPVP